MTQDLKKVDIAITTLMQIGEFVAAFSKQSWSPNGWPWLRKLQRGFPEAVEKHIDEYDQLFLYRAGPLRTDWYLIGKTQKPRSLPQYVPLHGFIESTIHRIGVEALQMNRFKLLLKLARSSMQIVLLCPAICVVLLLKLFAEWKRGAYDPEFPQGQALVILLIFGTASVLLIRGLIQEVQELRQKAQLL